MDSAFATAPYPSMTTLQLIKAISAGHENSKVMQGEVDRRMRADMGDKSVMTQGERLRFAQTGKAR